MILMNTRVVDKREYLPTTPKGEEKEPAYLVTFQGIGAQKVSKQTFALFDVGKVYAVDLILQESGDENA